MGNTNIGPGPVNNMNMGGMPSMSMPTMGQGPMGSVLTPEQQMALMTMYEQQAQMMHQIFSGQNPTPLVNPNFQHGRGGKRSFNSRGSSQGNKQHLPPSSKFTKKENQDENMAEGQSAENGEGMDMDTSRPEPFTIMCKFNQQCTKADCPFVHQSPAAVRPVTVDMNNTCSFGAACANPKCVGKHPSPAQRMQYQAEQECMFYPNCRDPANCPYKHPNVAACRNGADCTTPNCKFWHSSVVCKYNPCTNIRCPYKHAPGQRQDRKANVWVASKNGEEEKKDHVSERKFIDESKEEELILPDKPAEAAEAGV